MTISDQAVREALHAVRDPDIDKPIDDLGMVRAVVLDGGAVRVDVAVTVPNYPHQGELTARIRRAVSAVKGVESVDVELEVMDERQRANLVEGLRREIPFTKPDSRTTVIGVSSGKGGVGKSTVTTNLAAALQTLGHKVGIMDADIWGFSIPRMMGLLGKRPVAFNGMIMPLDANGVKVISLGAFVDSEETPVMFRGPMLHKALEQFLSDVYWPEDLEYLLIDLPPGTGDVAISLVQFLPGIAMLVVTTPQPVAQKVAERAANMSGKINLKLLGIVENMAGMVCEHCGELNPIFGSGGGKLLSDAMDVPLLASLPLVPQLRSDSDEGRPFVWSHPDHPVTKAYLDLARAVGKYRPRRRLPVK